MASPGAIQSTFCPVSVDEHISLPEFFTRYNPDDVKHDKVVHTDTISGKSLTYGGLREQAASCGWGLRNIGVKEGDVVLVVLPSCVSS
jgi:4-coumarate--CoA ligase